MKKWLKRNGKWLVIGFLILFMANASYSIVKADAAWKIWFHGTTIAVWLALLLGVLGIYEKLSKWWEKD